MKGFIGTILRWCAVCCWFAAVIAFWQQHVPPPASHVIPLNGRTAQWSPGMGDTIVLCGRGVDVAPSDILSGERVLHTPATIGPLQFYDPATGRLTHEALTAKDKILALTLKPRGVAVVDRNSDVRVVSIRDQKTLCELKDFDAHSEFVFADGARVLVCQRGKLATAFDLETGTELWSRNFVADLHGKSGGGCELVPVKRRNPSAIELWNCRTGIVDERFSSSSRPICVSDDGSRFAVAEKGVCRVFDSSLQRDVCQIPMVRRGAAAYGLMFDESGKKLFMAHHDKEVHEYSLWDCETGHELAFPPGTGNSFVGVLSSDMRLVARSENIPSFSDRLAASLPSGVVQRLQKSKLVWDLILRANRFSSQWIHLTDVATNRLVGRYEVPVAAEWLMTVDGNRHVAAFGDREAIFCYSIPPGKDWIWLLKWGLLPPAILAAIGHARSRLIHVWRQGRRAARETSRLN